MEIHHAVRDVVDRVGPGLLQDAESFRGVLDDVLDEEDAGVGEVNLLVDAVRFGAVDQLFGLLDSDADPALAVTTAGEGFARQRGGCDPRAASWACAVLGFAVGRVSDDVVRDLAARRPPADVVATMPQPMPQPTPQPTPTVVLEPDEDAPPVATAVSSSPASGTGEVASRSRSGRRLAVLLAVVAVGVVGVALGAFLALDGPTEEAAGDDTSAQETEAQCWNGEAAATVAGCSLPTDTDGLRWVFPVSDGADCDPEGPGYASKVVERWCPITLADGGDGQAHYSEWRDPAAMVDHYEDARVGQDLEVGRPDLVAFPVKKVDETQKVVLFYRDADVPFSVTVYADSEANLYDAVGRLMIRASDQLRGLGPGEEELPASFAVEPPLASG